MRVSASETLVQRCHAELAWLPTDSAGEPEFHAALVVAGGASLFLRRHNSFQEVGSAATVAFSVSYVVWGIADACWAVNYFIEGRSSREDLGIAITLLCSISFISASIGILCAVDGPLHRFFERRITTVSVAVATALISAILYFPYEQQARQDPLSLFNASELAAVASAHALLALGIMVLLSSKTLEWSIYGAGVMCLVLGDCSIRIGKILSDRIDLDGFSVLCSFGLYASLLPLVCRGEKSRVDPVDFASLFTSFKCGSVSLIFICLMAFLSMQAHNLQVIRLISLCCCFASFAAIFLSAFIIERIKSLSTILGDLMQEKLDNGVENHALSSRLPSELHEYYNYVITHAMQEKKNAAWQRELDGRHRLLRRVAHNILSPVAALTSQLPEMNALSEDCRLIVRSSVNDISDIANELKISGVSVNPLRQPSGESILLIDTVEAAVRQKRLQYRQRTGLQLEVACAESSYGVFVQAQETSLKTVISNLISNAAEAMSFYGSIRVSVLPNAETAWVCVEDSGCGISSERLATLCQEGATYGKPEGSGIGLHHARTMVEAWGGELEIDSRVGCGTLVRLRLLRRIAPAWFVSKIVLNSASTVVVLDDNPSIHHLWSKRINALEKEKYQVNLICLASSQELKAWRSSHTESTASDTVYLVDFELSEHHMNGLQVIEDLGISAQSLLVTSHYASVDVQEACGRAGVKLVPKSMVGVVPILRRNGESFWKKSCDAVLIEDDPVFRRIWINRAIKNHIKLMVFCSASEFYEKCCEINTTTPIYIDSDLGAAVEGEDDAKNIFYRLGFKNIFLATAHTTIDISNKPWITAITGKIPPWPVRAD